MSCCRLQRSVNRRQDPVLIGFSILYRMFTRSLNLWPKSSRVSLDTIHLERPTRFLTSDFWLLTCGLYSIDNRVGCEIRNAESEENGGSRWRSDEGIDEPVQLHTQPSTRSKALSQSQRSRSRLSSFRGWLVTSESYANPFTFDTCVSSFTSCIPVYCNFFHNRSTKPALNYLSGFETPGEWTFAGIWDAIDIKSRTEENLNSLFAPPFQSENFKYWQFVAFPTWVNAQPSQNNQSILTKPKNCDWS